MKNRNEIKSISMDCDVGLGSKMQGESSEFEKTRDFPFNQHQFDSAGNSSTTTPSAVGGGRRGGPFLWGISSIQACGIGDIYAAGSPVLPTTLDSSRFGASGGGGGGGGGMAVSEKSLFTASQLHELERQQIIHKYMMASVPVPHELMLPISRTSSFAASLSKTSGSGMDPRFSSSKSDPEPWRCRRTDGKKWRCSRNAAADQRYCERHSHKNKPRSRKHVEAKNNPQPLPTSHFPEIAPGLGAEPYDQARRMRGGSRGTAIPDSTYNYRQQMQQTSSRLDLTNRDNTHHQKNVCQSRTPHEQDFGAPIPERFDFSHGEYCGSILPSKMASFQENLSLDSDRTHTTPPLHFIDAWEQEGIKGLSPSSLTLSMSSSNRDDEGNKNDHHFGIGMSISQRHSPPGGPLGEALCLGYASSSNLMSPNDDTYTSNSCEDGSHAFNFIS